MLEELINLSHHFLQIKNQTYQRDFFHKISKKNRLSFLIGQRGVGKTTLLIQYLLSYVKGDIFSPKILYVQTDHFLVGSHSIYEIAESFQALGGELIVFDEIHKYPNWSEELKSIYDTFPHLKVIVSGSSALNVYEGTHDLSRRAIVYYLPGLSFREYLILYHSAQHEPISLSNLLQEHSKINLSITNGIKKTKKKILPHFADYLKFGFYPFYREVEDLAAFYLLVEQNLHTTIESDLSAIHPQLNGNSIKKIKQILSFIASNVPFMTNWQQLKNLLEIGDERTLKTYVKYLADADAIRTLSKMTNKLSKMESIEKIYLNNPNQMCALSYNHLNKGTLRETFFINTLCSAGYTVTFPMNGDFCVDHQHIFEVGGKKKSFEQIATQKHAYLACDEIEQGMGHKIPLWMFGFLY